MFITLKYFCDHLSRTMRVNKGSCREVFFTTLNMFAVGLSSTQ